MQATLEIRRARLSGAAGMVSDSVPPPWLQAISWIWVDVLETERRGEGRYGNVQVAISRYSCWGEGGGRGCYVTRVEGVE